MSVDKLKEMLELLRYYNTVEITHTFRHGDQPFLSVCCLKNTITFQITNIEEQTVHHYNCLEEAAIAIEKLISFRKPS
ncbi:hypothetical protein AC623_11850 [Bacillus sp. FJAT-27231]|uniref:hypothetical protein n=1 Tax=Bacillus sp. FJAT-27231 TaxID=1679168 RepID=UPI00067116D3|nr:hypothetical protein [Bacillus sp. FJAT-27231]KMY54521.1 hypothetical protein AC623_11850 [Bacillus sp. FJAT-27231]